MCPQGRGKADSGVELRGRQQSRPNLFERVAVAERTGVRSWRKLPYAALLCGEQPTKAAQSLGDQLGVGLYPCLLSEPLKVLHGYKEGLVEFE